jgi:hypothetical protein
MEETLNIELLVSSNTIRLEDIPLFKTGLKIINGGTQNISPDVSMSELFVNNIKNIAWDLAVQNGTVINIKVLPKKSETVLWPLGEALFETSGTYELELRWESLIQKQKVIVSE